MEVVDDDFLSVDGSGVIGGGARAEVRGRGRARGGGRFCRFAIAFMDSLGVRRGIY